MVKKTRKALYKYGLHLHIGEKVQYKQATGKSTEEQYQRKEPGIKQHLKNMRDDTQMNGQRVKDRGRFKY